MRKVFFLLIALSVLASGAKTKRSRAGAPDQVFRGVNLGGWLVLESWITPSLFSNNSVADGLGEWQFCAQVGPTNAPQVMNAHWDTWLLQSDIAAIAASGLTHVRIPVGYWIVDIQPGEPFVSGGWNYLLRALQWIKQAGLFAVIDLHGAPGSQNGFDNSGYAGPINWPIPSNINRTIYDLGLIAAKVVELNAQPATLNVVSAIELLNEPKTTAAGGPIQMETLMLFYEQAYTVIRQANFTGAIWVHDGFNYNSPLWDQFMPPPYYTNVYIDTHIYHAFGGPSDVSTPWGNIQYTCQSSLPMIAQHVWSDWTIVGEWSLAFGPATPLNVLDGVGWLLSFAQAQMQAYCPQCCGSSTLYQAGQGYFFWNFKIETGYQEWNYLQGLSLGYFPTNASAPFDPFAFSCPNLYNAPPFPPPGDDDT